MRRHDHFTGRLALRRAAFAATTALAATAALAAAPAVESVTLLTDETHDTIGLTSPADVDGRVDITGLRYERSGSIATFTIHVTDVTDTAVEDVLDAKLRGGVSFRIDDCWYDITLDGRVGGGCHERDVELGIADVVIDLVNDTYRLSFDFDELRLARAGDLRPGAWADAPRAWLNRSHLDWTDPLPDGQATRSDSSRDGVGLGGCSPCGGQADTAWDDTADWQL